MDEDIPCTTRMPRMDEVNNTDYHFVSRLQFDRMMLAGLFAETAEHNGWWYGTAGKDFEDDADNKTAVLTPHGIRCIKKCGIKIYTVYIKIPRRDRLIKILQRGDNIEETYRRNLSDVGQFDGIEDEVDLVIENNRYAKSVKDIASIIYYSYMSSVKSEKHLLKEGRIRE